MVCHDRLLIGPPLLDDRRVVDDRTRHHAPRARMDGWWPCALGDFIQTYRARPTAVYWGIPGYAQPGVRRSWGKCAIAFPSPTASASKCPARLTPGPFSWMNHLASARSSSDGGIVRPRAFVSVTTLYALRTPTPTRRVTIPIGPSR